MCVGKERDFQGGMSFRFASEIFRESRTTWKKR